VTRQIGGDKSAMAYVLAHDEKRRPLGVSARLRFNSGFERRGVFLAVGPPAGVNPVPKGRIRVMADVRAGRLIPNAICRLSCHSHFGGCNG
jgi:hypothetical protein